MAAITGAFGYIGRYISRRLLSSGKRVRTLTNHPNRENPFGDKVSVAPLDFHRQEELVYSLKNATTLYNTYWIRFPRGPLTFEKAVENSKALITAAQEAGVHRIVYISITNADESSPLPYFRGKGLVEKAIMESGLSYAIVRPTVVFGPEDILINNMAWLLRRFPVFAVFGSGEYRLQPVFVEDVAQIAFEAGQQRDNVLIDAVGPEVYTFDELVSQIASAVGSRARIAHVTPAAALLLSRLVGVLMRDVVVTRDEVKGLMSNLLVPEGRPTATTRISDWLRQNASAVGTRYASELARHYR